MNINATGTAQSAFKNVTYKAKGADIRNYDKAERVSWLSQQETRYEAYWEPEIQRAVRNARMYWHVNFGQWPQVVVERLREQGRRPPTYPIIPDKIETLIGSFLANGFDMRYEPMNDKLSTMCVALQDMYYSDKSQMDWETSEIECLLNAFIMVGYERMTISDKVDDFGNIAWENVDPRHVLKSPSWKSNDVGDLRDYFVWEYMTATEIMNNPAFKHNSSKLKDAKTRESIEGIDYGVYSGGAPRWATLEEKWQAQHKVIEFHYIKDETRDYEYDLKNHCFFPETGYKINSPEDVQAKMKYAEMMGLTSDDITFMGQRLKTKCTEVICPTLDNEMFLQQGKDLIQTNNCNLYPLSIRYRGQDQGIVDRLYDIQQGINKAEMTDQDIMQRSAKGAFAIDKAVADGDPQKMDEIEQQWNAPGARIWLEEDSTKGLQNGGIIELPGSHLGADRTNWLQAQYDKADRLSKVSAAADSRTESGQESGKLYSMKVQMGNISQKYLLKFYERHKKAKAEAYMYQAKITYSGYPRTFGKQNGKGKITINQRIQDDGGNLKVLDDISKLPRMKVIITPAKEGTNVKNMLKAEMSDYLQLLVNPEDALLRTVINGSLILSTDMPEESREPLEYAVEMSTAEAALAQALRIQQYKQQFQVMEKAQQAAQQQAQAQGMPMPTEPEPEAPIEPQITDETMTQEQAAEGLAPGVEINT